MQLHFNFFSFSVSLQEYQQVKNALLVSYSYFGSDRDLSDYMIARAIKFVPLKSFSIRKHTFWFFTDVWQTVITALIIPSAIVDISDIGTIF